MRASRSRSAWPHRSELGLADGPDAALLSSREPARSRRRRSVGGCGPGCGGAARPCRGIAADRGGERAITGRRGHRGRWCHHALGRGGGDGDGGAGRRPARAVHLGGPRGTGPRRLRRGRSRRSRRRLGPGPEGCRDPRAGLAAGDLRPVARGVIGLQASMWPRGAGAPWCRRASRTDPHRARIRRPRSTDPHPASIGRAGGRPARPGAAPGCPATYAAGRSSRRRAMSEQRVHRRTPAAGRSA